MSDASGITAERQIESEKEGEQSRGEQAFAFAPFGSREPPCGDRGDHRITAPASRSSTPARAPHSRSIHATSGGLSNQTSR